MRCPYKTNSHGLCIRLLRKYIGEIGVFLLAHMCSCCRCGSSYRVQPVMIHAETSISRKMYYTYVTRINKWQYNAWLKSFKLLGPGGGSIRYFWLTESVWGTLCRGLNIGEYFSPDLILVCSWIDDDKTGHAGLIDDLSLLEPRFSFFTRKTGLFYNEIILLFKKKLLAWNA